MKSRRSTPTAFLLYLQGNYMHVGKTWIKFDVCSTLPAEEQSTSLEVLMADILTIEQMKERVLLAFTHAGADDPFWFQGVRECTEEDPKDAHLMVRINTGEYALFLCASEDEFNRVLRDGKHEDLILVIIWPKMKIGLIRQKCLKFFEREWRERSKYGLRWTRTRR